MGASLVWANVLPREGHRLHVEEVEPLLVVGGKVAKTGA